MPFFARPSRIFPARSRKRAIDKAVAFVTERLNGEDGLGAIFPAMANSVMMFDALGYPPDHPDVKVARASIDKLLVIKPDEAYCQPCVSPVWDTVLTCHALMETAASGAAARVKKGLDWLKPLQVLDVAGDWVEQSPGVRPGGWAFQYANPHYPGSRRHRGRRHGHGSGRPGAGASARFDHAIERAREWIVGLQSRNGGWAAFDANNDREYLNNIPFSDHGALLDPPTADLTARCLSMLAQLGEQPATSPAMAQALDFLRRDQRPDGSWYGRWGMNYIYGTWSVLCALNAAGMPHDSPEMRKAVDWLIVDPECRRRLGRRRDELQARLSRPRNRARAPPRKRPGRCSASWRRAKPIIRPSSAGSLICCGRKTRDGLWDEQRFTATGFPARLLPALSRLSEIFSALGAGAISQPEGGQHARRRVRHVTPCPKSDRPGRTGAAFEAASPRATASSSSAPAAIRRGCGHCSTTLDPRRFPRRDQLRPGRRS